MISNERIKEIKKMARTFSPVHILVEELLEERKQFLAQLAEIQQERESLVAIAKAAQELDSTMTIIKVSASDGRLGNCFECNESCVIKLEKALEAWRGDEE